MKERISPPRYLELVLKVLGVPPLAPDAESPKIQAARSRTSSPPPLDEGDDFSKTDLLAP
jgi:hypothetical protein